jgi:hypothetical protein
MEASKQGANEMTYKVKDIAHETGTTWVLKNTKQGCYTVFIIGTSVSTSDSAYPLTDDGLSIAIARANYLAKRIEAKKVSK